MRPSVRGKFYREFAVECVVIGAARADESDGGRRVHVQPAREQVRHVVPPHHARLAQREHILGNKAQNGLDAELRIFQKAQQQFGRTVARAAADAVHRHVQHGRAPTCRLDGIAERELLVVVRVHADDLFVFFAVFEVAQRQFCDLFGIQRTV